MNHVKVRTFLHSGRDLPLDMAAHLENCAQCQEYAAMIRLLEAELPALWPETTPASASVNRVMARVLEVARERRPRERVFRFGQEMGWVGIAILFGLVIAWMGSQLDFSVLIPAKAPSTPLSTQILEEDRISEYTEEVDLNCDEKIERLVVSQIVHSDARQPETRVSLEADLGRGTVEVWALSSDALGVETIEKPQLILVRPEACEQLVAVPISSKTNLYGDLRVFVWNGEMMNEVLNATGWPVLDPVLPGRIMTVAYQVDNSGRDRCGKIYTTYEWDQTQFEKTSSYKESVPCGDFRRMQPTGMIFQALGKIGEESYTQMLAQTDLNCDGRFERLVAELSLPSSFEYMVSRVYRLSLEATQKSETTSLWTLPAGELSYFSKPELFSIGACEQFLAFSVYPPQTFGYLQIYRWDGEQMNRVLNGTGLVDNPQSLVSLLPQTPNTPFTISTMTIGTQQVEPGWCENVRTFYQWDGMAFVETQKLPERVKCGD